MCIAAQLEAPTSGTAVFTRCLLSSTAGSFLLEGFPWAVYFQPPKPILSPSVRGYSDSSPHSCILSLSSFGLNTHKEVKTHTHNEQSVKTTFFTTAMHWARICYRGKALGRVNFKREKEGLVFSI